MRYQELPPPAPLRDWVRCFWVLEDADARGPGPLERVLPDGCIELVLHHGERFLRHDAGGVERQPTAVVAGQIRAALRLQSTGRVGAFGVRFEPAGAALFLGPDADELTDRIVALSDLAPQDGEALTEALAEADGDAARVALMSRWLLRRLADRAGASGAGTAAPGDHRADARNNLAGGVAAVAHIERRAGNVGVGDLASHLGWSTRRLQRAFLAHVGVSPKTFARVVRFQRVVRALGRDPSTRLAELALDAGYADQAHLARDFRELAGLPATAWLAEQHPFGDCIAGTSRPAAGFVPRGDEAPRRGD